jgi:hypothetical protein
LALFVFMLLIGAVPAQAASVVLRGADAIGIMGLTVGGSK